MGPDIAELGCPTNLSPLGACQQLEPPQAAAHVLISSSGPEPLRQRVSYGVRMAIGTTWRTPDDLVSPAVLPPSPLPVRPTSKPVGELVTDHRPSSSKVQSGSDCNLTLKYQPIDYREAMQHDVRLSSGLHRPHRVMMSFSQASGATCLQFLAAALMCQIPCCLQVQHNLPVHFSSHPCIVAP